jgi:hypothetical protein
MAPALALTQSPTLTFWRSLDFCLIRDGYIRYFENYFSFLEYLLHGLMHVLAIFCPRHPAQHNINSKIKCHGARAGVICIYGSGSGRQFNYGSSGPGLRLSATQVLIPLVYTFNHSWASSLSKLTVSSSPS